MINLLTDYHINAKNDFKSGIKCAQNRSTLRNVECSFKSIEIRGHNGANNDKYLPDLINLAIERDNKPITTAPLLLKVLLEPRGELEAFPQGFPRGPRRFTLSFRGLRVLVGAVVTLFIVLFFVGAGCLVQDLVFESSYYLVVAVLVPVLVLFIPAYHDSELQVVFIGAMHFFSSSGNKHI